MPRSSRTSTPRLPFEDPAAPAASDLPDAADRAAAVDPTRNVVLEASAGTGKTRVLVDRYTNLLKARVDPANILAITFTRKAAAEMRERILQNLQSAAATGEIDATRWRDLRDRLGDIAISTIDAFCLSLLREFPLEADLDPGFTMADDTEVLRLTDEGLDRALRVCRGIAAADPAVALLFAQLGEPKLRAGLAVLLDRRLVAHDALRRFLVHGPADVNPDVVCVRAAARLADTLRSVEGGLAAFLADGPRFHPRFAMLARDIETLAPAGPAGSADPAELASRMRLIADGLRDHFLNDKGEPRTRWPYKASDADTPEAWKRHRDRAQRLAPAIAADLARFSRDLNVVLSHAVWRVFEVALSGYRRTLAAHAVVDFPDALWRTLDLLAQMDEFAQSRYLLRRAITTCSWTSSRTRARRSGSWSGVWCRPGAKASGWSRTRRSPPSIFIVGDRKQSIYGFRDADVGVLGAGRAASPACGQDGSVRRAIRKSFRAVPALLAFANDLFDAVEKAGAAATRSPTASRIASRSARRRAPAEPVLGLVVAPDAALVRRARRERGRQAADIGTGARQGDRSRARRPAGRHRHPVPLARGAPGVRVCARGARHPAPTSTRGSASSRPTRSRTCSRCFGISRTRRRICARRRSCARASCGCPTRRCSSWRPGSPAALGGADAAGRRRSAWRIGRARAAHATRVRRGCRWSTASRPPSCWIASSKTPPTRSRRAGRARRAGAART